MAEGGYERLPDNDDDPRQENDDSKAGETFNFGSFTSSTPAPHSQEIKMTSFQKEKSGLPDTSYTETSFGGTADIEKRLFNLRRNAETGMLDTTEIAKQIKKGIPNVENPLGVEERKKEIQRVRGFIRARYPEANLSQLVISFSSSIKKPMDIVVKGTKGGETKILKDDGSGFQKSFLDLKFVQRALSDSFEVIEKRSNQRIIKERLMLADALRKNPKNVGLIDSLKDKISKKETEKKEKEREFFATKQTEEIEELKEELEKENEQDLEIINDENVSPQDKEAAEQRIAIRNEEIADMQTLIQEREDAMTLREKIKKIFKNYGVTLTAILLAAGATIASVISTITNALKKVGTELGNGLKTLGEKAASALPGLIGDIVSFLFKAASSAIGFIAEHTWPLILAVVAFLFQSLVKKN